MKIHTNKLWEDLNSNFNAERDLDLITLSLLCRLTLERYKSKSDISTGLYSSLHNLLHYDSAGADRSTNLDTLYKIVFYLKVRFRDLPEINKILSSLKDNSIDDFFNIDDRGVILKDWQEKVVYISSASVISIKNGIYQYKFQARHLEKEYTFLSDKQLLIKKPYKISIETRKLNGEFKRYWLSSSSLWVEQFKTEFNNKIGFNWTNNLNQMKKHFNLSLSPLPYDKTHKNRRFIWAAHAALSMNPRLLDDFKYKDYLPFVLHRLNAKLPKNDLSIDEKIKIIESYKGESWYLEDYYTNFINKSKADQTNDAMSYGDKETDGNHFKTVLKLNTSDLYIERYLNTIKNFKECFIKLDFKDFNLNNIDEKINHLKQNKSIMLHGPAGHGKTWTIKKVIEQNCEMNIKLIAPTWKAINIYGHIILDENVNTSQKLSNLTMSNYKWEAKQELDSFFSNLEILIIDEVSMIDNWDFLREVRKDTRIIFSGDNFQIPPIHGNQPSKWLEEISRVNKGLLSFEKKENYRLLYKNGIKKTNEDLKYATKINNLLGKIRKEKFKLNVSGDFEGIIEFRAADSIFDYISDLNKQDFRFIVQKNIGKFGTELLNGITYGDIENEFDFKEEDLIIFTEGSNEALRRNKAYNQTEATIKNVSYDENAQKMHYSLLNRTGRFDFSCIKGHEPFERAKFLTAHKAQGSSIENVAVIISEPISFRWLYTAASRASEKLILIFLNNIDISDITKDLKMRNVDKIIQ